MYHGAGEIRTETAPAGAIEGGGRMPQDDICSGWRSDGTMMVAIRTGGRIPTPVGPAAPDLDAGDPASWHAVGRLPADSMRRRRLVDVAGGNGAPLAVYAMFRDTHASPDGIERVLHEYTVEATVDPHDLRVLHCQATPRSLPWPECPAAADSARRLEGEPLAGLRPFVQRNLRGISTCTHLNDLLRSLAGVEYLAAILAGHAPP